MMEPSDDDLEEIYFDCLNESDETVDDAAGLRGVYDAGCASRNSELEALATHLESRWLISGDGVEAFHAGARYAAGKLRELLKR